MDISLLTLLVGLALGTFALGFIFARLAKLARLSSPAQQFATEGATAGRPATPEPADVLTHTQLHYQQTHINGLNTNLRMLEEKLRWMEQDRQDAEDTIADLQRKLREASGPRGDEVTQREAEIALLRAQLNAAISNTSKLELKLIRAEHDAQSAREENQNLSAKLWAQQSTDVALSRLQDRQTALQNAIQEHLQTRDKLAKDVVALNATLNERESALAERTAALQATERRLQSLNEAYARLVERENAWEKLKSTLADTEAQATQAEAARDVAQAQVAALQLAQAEAGAQLHQVTERLHSLHEALALRDGQVTELHGEVRRLQQEIAVAQDAIAETEAERDELRGKLAPAVAAAEEARTLLRVRESTFTTLQEQLAQAGQQRQTLEAALVLATSHVESLREQLSDAEAGRMLLEAELQNKTAALEMANEDLAQLSSREYELTVALERSGREHQSSFETALLHMNRVEADLAHAQAALAEKTEEAQALDMQLLAARALLEERAQMIATEQARASELADTVNALEMARTTLETHLQAKTAVLATAEAVIASMREQVAERDVQLANLRALAGERGEVLESLQSQNALLQEHLTLRDQQLDDLRTLAGERGDVLESLQSQITSLQEHLTLRDQQLDDLRILAGERARELESAQAQIAYLTGGLDELNSEANEKFEALQAAQKAHETALTRITEMEAEQERLKSQLAVALQRHEALAVETASLHDELSGVLKNASDLQEKLSEAQTQIAQLEDAQAMAGDMLEAQAGEIIALSNERMQSDSALKLAEARASDLTTAITSTQATLASTQGALDTLQQAHMALLAEKAAIDNLLQVQAGEIDTLANLLRQREAEFAQAEASMAQLNEQVSKAGAQAITLEAALLEKTTQLEQAQVSLDELRQAHALMLQEQDTLRQTRDALEVQTRNQMETLVEMSNEAAAMQQLLQARESALKAAQAALDDAQQVINAKPEPGTVEAQLIDVTLTLQRLEGEYAALQVEKDAIEDEYTREQIAGQLRMQAKEVALRDCGSRVDALELEIALMKAKGE